MNALSALDKLKQGNQRFVAALQHGVVDVTIEREKMSAKQTPFAIVLGCADSRVPVELIFDQSVGELFVVRVAGNIASSTQIGSIEFACQQFGTPLVVVLGHSNCGAVAATLDYLQNKGGLSPHLMAIVDQLKPAVEPLLNTQYTPEQRLHQACMANIEQSIKALLQNSAMLHKQVQQQRLSIVGAHYCLTSGQVDFQL